MRQTNGYVLIGFLIALGAGLFALGYTYFFHAPKNNEVEKIAEEIIKDETGLDVDLSPETPDSKIETITETQMKDMEKIQETKKPSN
jgi:hypothetical protein